MSVAPMRRVTHLDALRGLAVLGVVLAHSIALPNLAAAPTPGSVPFDGQWMAQAAVTSVPYNLIASVYMPLFAFVSGLAQGLRGPEVGWDTVRRRFGGLMVPYLAWAAVGGVVAYRTALADPTSWLKSLAMALIDPRAGGAWFLYALFGCYVLAATAWRAGKRPASLVLAAGLVPLLLLLRIPNWLGIRDVALLFPFFAAGLLGVQTDRLRSRAAILLGAAAYPLSLALTWPTVVDVERWWLPAYRGALSTAGIASRAAEVWLPNAVVLAGKYACAGAGAVLLYSLFARLPERVNAPLAWIGRRSLGVYVIHYSLVVAAIGLGLRDPIALLATSTTGALAITRGLEQVPMLARVLLGQSGAPRQAST